MRARAVERGLSYTLRQLVRWRGIKCAFTQYCREIDERLRLSRTGSVDPLCVAGWKSVDFAIQRERLRNTSKQVETDNSRRLLIARNAIAGVQRLHLARKTERPAVIGGVKRLESLGIARQENPLPNIVPDCQSEHSSSAVHHCGPMPRIEMEHGLGAGGRAKLHPI